MQFFAALTLFAASVSAYTVLTPTLNSTITKGTDVNVEWTSVDTDASTFSIYLVNFQAAHWPPTVLSLAQNVPQGDGSIEVRIPCDVTSDYGWQINFINGTNTYVIYAQSSMFSLTGDCVDPTTSSSVAVATTTVINNSTVTATATTTVKQVVETIVYENPVVWFVQPSAIVAANGAMCPPAAQQTVTVYANGAAPVTCGAASAVATGAAGSGTYGNYTVTSGVSKSTTKGAASSTGAVLVPSTTSTKAATFTGAASSFGVGGGAVALVAGVVAMVL